ncbi:MAG TPA: hypothetical protein ENN99_06950 [Chloroflexi bacterium]|nr:hypothetical protein [Chloroflexota bacterium]
MSRKQVLVGLLILQVVAIIIYPPAFLQQAPQSAVLPPALLILFILALVGVNLGVLTPAACQTLLIFVQGVNIVVRLIMFFPNLQTARGSWDWLFTLCMLIGMGISWFVITQVEKRPPSFLLLRPKSTD